MTLLAGWQVGLAALHHNFRGNQLTIAIAVAKAESGWHTDSRYHTSQEDSRGLWQINLYAHPKYSPTRLYEAEYNAQAAWEVYSNSNHTWRPWTTYTRGTYKKFMDQASAAVDQLRSMGYDPGATTSFGPGDGGGTPTPVQQVLGARWDYTPEMHVHGQHMQNWASDFLTGGNAILGLLHWETIGNG